MRCLQVLIVAILLTGGALPQGERAAAATPTEYWLQSQGGRPREGTPPALVLVALVAAFVGLRFSRTSRTTRSATG